MGHDQRRVSAVLVLVTAATVVVTALVIAAYVLRHGAVLTVQSDSMSPLIRRGDAVFVRDVPDYIPSVGDIVSYRSPIDGRLITHRVMLVTASARTVVTKGDNLQTNDPAVPIAELKGPVSAVLPLAGKGLDLFRHPISIAVLVYTPAVLLCTSEVQKLAAHYRRPVYQLIPSARNSV
ncbi:MAG: signal peptidase [Candidatus Saccharibacteria bacterium]|nr:signal peptidase [Candidatus Saccharibacteria bacterium]